ncbi:hypothetical protein ACQJBY_041871 [Aegilops geniculata]
MPAAERHPDDLRDVRRPPWRARAGQRLHGQLIRHRHRLQLPDGHVLRPRHPLRAGLRSEPGRHARGVQTEGDAGAGPGERSDRGGVGEHRRNPTPPGAGPGDRGGGRDVHPVDDPCALLLRLAAVPRPVPAGAEAGVAGDAQLRRHRGESRGGVLGAGVKAAAGDERGGAGQRRVVLHQRLHTGRLRQGLAVVQEELDGVLSRGAPRPLPLLEARRAIRTHGLHGVVVVRGDGDNLGPSPQPQARDSRPLHLLEHQLLGVHGPEWTLFGHKHARVQRARGPAASGGASGGPRGHTAGVLGGHVGGAPPGSGAQSVGLCLQQGPGGGLLRRQHDAHPRHLRSIRRPPVRPLRYH